MQTAITEQLPAKVISDPNSSGELQVMHGGRVVATAYGLPIAGQRVQKGQVLAYIDQHSEHFARGNQQALLRELQAKRKLAEQQLQRLQQLQGSIAQKQIDRARIELNGLRQREAEIAHSLETREALIAPVSGVIAESRLITGHVVQPHKTLVHIINPQQLLIEAFTGDTTLITDIEAAYIQSLPEARLELIGAARTLRNGVLPLTFRVSSDQPLPLAIQQPLTLIIQRKQQLNGLVMPASALVRDNNNQPMVWIKTGAQRFLAQAVVYQPLNAEQIVVTAGLAADNRVVTQGAILLTQIR